MTRATFVDVLFADIVLVDVGLVNVTRPKSVVVVREAMCGTGAVTEAKRRDGGQYAKHVKGSQHGCRPNLHCPTKTNEQPPLPNSLNSVTPSEVNKTEIFAL